MSRKRLAQLLKVQDVNWLNSALNISLRNRYVYVETPKVGSSTVKAHLHALELLPLRNVKVGPHPDLVASPFVKPFQMPLGMLEEALFGPDFFRFCIVRNPFDRILSAYLDKIQGEAPEIGQIRTALGKPGLAGSEISFAMFLDAVAGLPDRHRDKHWRTQTGVTMSRVIDFEFVGKLENLNDSLGKIQAMAGIDFRDVKRHAPHQTGATEKHAQYYTPELVAKVAEIYAEDFERFGYRNTLDLPAPAEAPAPAATDA